MAETPELMASPADVERRIVTVLFADLVGFTSLSEAMDAEDVATVQDAYFAAARETMQRYGGAVEKFIGDAAMAVFGTPRTRDDDAERAVRAGLALIGALEQIEARLGMAPHTLQLRVGVNTGEVVYAASGIDAGRVTGDTVNTAARLQAAARPGAVLMGETTALSVADAIETQPIGTAELKGKAEPVRVWEGVGARPHSSREEALGDLRAPMLGRDAEMQRLHAALEAVAQGRASDRLVIVAPPGVGKSRLLAEFAAATDARVLRARVRPQATAPFETVAQLLVAAGALGGGLPAALAAAGVPAARAAVIGEEVARLLDSGAGTIAAAGDIVAEREIRFDAWTSALDALTSTASVWLVEDAHWAGGDLLAFLDQAGRAATRHGRLVVATARPSLLESASAWAKADRLDLAPLPATDAGALVRALLGAALPDELLAAVVDRSDGNPLFIEELLRTWASVGALVREGAAWRLAVEPGAVSLPPTVQAIYAAQLDDLPPDARLLARRGAVAGRRVPIAALPALEIHGHEGLEALRRRAFLAGPVDDDITGDGYTYRHALLRDAGYASLARAERSRLHLAMARWLEAVAGERVDVVAEAIAEHLGAALASLPAVAVGDVGDGAALAAKAATWFERAAEAAMRLAAIDAAQRLFARAIELTADDAPVDRARRRLRLGEVLAASADLDAGIGEMEAALEGFGHDPAAVDTAFALARAYMQQVRFPEAEQLTAEALDRFAAQPAHRLARLHALHAWSVAAQGRSEGVRAETDLAWSAVDDAGDPNLELDVLEHVNAARDEIDEASESDWERLEQKALAARRWHQVAVAGRVRAMFLADVDPSSALGPLTAVAELASAHGLTEQAGWADYARCETLWVLGEWDAALALGEQTVALGERFAYQRLAFRTWMLILPMAAARRSPEPAEKWLTWWEGAAAHFPGNPSPYALVLRAAYGVWVAQATGRRVPVPPDELVDAVIPMGNPHFVAAIETVVRACLDSGRVEVAMLAAQRWAAMAADPGSTRLMRTSAALVEAWTSGSQAPARRALDLAREHGAPWWELRALQAMDDPAAPELARALGIR